MKRFVSVVLATGMSVMFLTSCGKSPEVGSYSYEQIMAKFNGEPERNVTIKVLENDIAVDEGYFGDLIAAFNAEYAEYGIKAEDANMSQYTDLEKNGPLGYGPDVLYDANDKIMRYAENGHVLPLPTERLDVYGAGNLETTVSDSYKMNKYGMDLQFGVPINVQTLVMYYLEDTFKGEADTNKNAVPDVLETYNALYAYSKEIRKGSTNDNRVFGYVQSLNNEYFNFGYLLSYGAYIFGDSTRDIGLAAGESYKGLQVMQALASIMDSDASGDSYTVQAYSGLASGKYRATITTPDVYVKFYNSLVDKYVKTDKMAREDAEKKAAENLKVSDVPRLPRSGNLGEVITDIDSQTFAATMMGGINGYAISSYTKNPKASLLFIDFASRYEQVVARASKLGVVPARKDAAAAENTNAYSEMVYKRIEEGRVTIMPSVRDLSYVWSSVSSMFALVADDVTVKGNGSPKDYNTADSLKALLVKAVDDIKKVMQIS